MIYLSSVIWGPATVAALIVFGIFLTIKLRFIQLRRFPSMLREVFGGNRASRRSLMTALAGTLGTGNIIGVGTAISLGGAGAIFWMWVSAFFGMAIKYTEIMLAQKYRTADGKGGGMYMLKNGLRSPFLGGLFAVLCIVASFGIGNAVQSNSAAVALRQAFDIPAVVTSAAVAFVVGLVLCGGANKVFSFCERMVPSLAAVYMILAVLVLIICRQGIVPAFGRIFSEGFNFHSAAGGIAGSVAMSAIKYGTSRGIFTNEAGLGSAPIAHSASDNPRQGLWGMFEVFFDTIVMCTVTALVILCSGVVVGGDNVTLSAFESVLGSISGKAVGICTAMFAVCTIVAWSFYAERCIEFLTPKKSAIKTYRSVYTAVAFVGGILSLSFVWECGDVFNGLMMIVNLIGIVGLSVRSRFSERCR